MMEPAAPPPPLAQLVSMAPVSGTDGSNAPLADAGLETAAGAQVEGQTCPPACPSRECEVQNCEGRPRAAPVRVSPAALIESDEEEESKLAEEAYGTDTCGLEGGQQLITSVLVVAFKHNTAKERKGAEAVYTVPKLC